MVGHCRTWCTVLLYFFQAVADDIDTSVAANRLHIVNISRYEACPFHAMHSYGFACHRAQPQKTTQIFQHTTASLLTPANFSSLAGQTIFFAGDSLVRNQYTALACHLWGIDSSITEEDVIAGEVVKVQKITSRKFDLELQFTFTGVLLDLHETQLPKVYTRLDAIDLYPFVKKVIAATPSVPTTISTTSPPIRTSLRTPTIVLLSVGHHFDLSKYTNISATGEVVDLKLYELAIRRSATLLQQLLDDAPEVRVIFRSVPPRHYVHGDWNTGGRCDQSMPCPLHFIRSELTRNNSNYWKAAVLSNILQHVAAEYQFEYLNILSEALHRCDGMVGSLPVGMKSANVSDCSHYCVPGVPDVWNTLLLHHIVANTKNHKMRRKKIKDSGNRLRNSR